MAWSDAARAAAAMARKAHKQAKPQRITRANMMSHADDRQRKALANTLRDIRSKGFKSMNSPNTDVAKNYMSLAKTSTKARNMMRTPKVVSLKEVAKDMKIKQARGIARMNQSGPLMSKHFDAAVAHWPRLGRRSR